MAWQSDTINPASTSPAGDITKITNDLQQLRSVLAGGTDAAIPTTALQAIPKDASVTTAKLAAVIAPTVSSINGGQLAGLRNKIINGKMEIAQRGASFAAIANGAYSLDRWLWGFVSSGAVTITQQADAPSDNEFQYSLRAAVTTADTSIAATDVARVVQRIEGFNVRDLIGRTFTLSFRVRSSKTGVHCVAFSNSAGDRSYVAEYTINAANTWETKSITVTGGLITAGTWNYLNGTGLEVNWVLAAGSTYQTTAGAWQTGNFFDTANQVNCLDTVGNIFAVTGVQLEVGAVATPFEHRPFGSELNLCQRYFERLPARMYGSYCTATGAPTYVTWQFKVQKRATPTISVAGANYSGTSATCVDFTDLFVNTSAQYPWFEVGNTASAEL